VTLAEFRDWLKTVIDCPQWYLNSMAGKVDRCITLYNTTGAPGRMAVGGPQATGYAVKPVSILVHWGKSASVAETKAQEVYDALFGASGEVDGKRFWFHMPQSGPISVGVDSEGVHEFVIETHIYHER
jgi:hypothetical protein